MNTYLKIGFILVFLLSFSSPAKLLSDECDFQNNELLSWPTASSVTLSVIPKESVELYVEYGTESNYYSFTTQKFLAESGELASFLLDKLSPGTRYYYRLRCNNKALEEYSFVTTRKPGSKFSFGFGTDSHGYATWSAATCSKKKRGLQSLNKTFKTISRMSDELDFFVVGGDWSSTHCDSCPSCYVDGKAAGKRTVRNSSQAELRHRLSRRLHEEFGHSLPAFFVLGNHEGEAGFAANRCSYRTNTLDLSINARLKHLPLPPSDFNSAKSVNYYAFESGDALVIVLDVMRYTESFPQSVDDWTLGATQLAWLEDTLSRSERKWKFVFMEHLVGGNPRRNCYFYGRGGVNTTDTKTPAGKFLGEQAVLHEMFKQFGVQLVFYGHDHIFSVAEKQNSSGAGEGIYYICGGRMAGVKATKWTNRPYFTRLYDHDGDGRGDWLTNNKGGSKLFGFFRIDIEGEELLRFSVIKTGPGKDQDSGQVIFTKELRG